MKRSTATVWVAIGLLLVLGLAACGGKATPTDTGARPTTQSTQATAAPATAKATAAPAKTTVPPTSAPTVEPTEEAVSIADRAEGLDQLTSYRARWQSEWSGTKDGKETSVSWDWREEYISDPQALHFVFKSVSSAEPDKGGVFEIWQVGGTTYMLTEEQGKQTCTAMTNEAEDNAFERGLFNPSSLGSINSARYVGMDTVNGVRARHYKYDEKSANLVGFAKASGEMWVAVDGGYVVKDTLAWEGGAGFLAMGASDDAVGKGQWAWELSDINQRFTIEPPANCESAASDLPLLADAPEKSTFGDMIIYKTATRLADAVKFYQEKMPSAGWRAEGEPMITDAFAQLSFTKEGQTAQIMLSTDNDKTQIIINVQK